jgi:hypothetical protein
MRLAAQSAGPDVWSARPVPCTGDDCRALARTARQLLGVKGAIHKLVGRLAGDTWAVIRGEGFEARLARAVGSRIPLPVDQAFVQTAKCLRALGILCCLSAGRDMTKCGCLLDFAGDATIAALKAELREVADPGLWLGAAA